MRKNISTTALYCGAYVLQVRVCGMRFGLACFHFLPVEKSVYIVEKERDEANDNGNVANVGDACQRPKNNQNDIVCGICNGKERTSAEREIYGEKTGGHRNGTRNHIRGVKKVQNKVKNKGDDCGGEKHETDFVFADCVDLHFRLVSFIWMSEPGHQCKNCHGHGHAEIGQHFAVVGKSIGNDAV